MRRLWGFLILVGACGSASPVYEAPALEPTPPEEEVPATPTLATCTVVYAATVFTGGPVEARGEGATHTEACRAAALSVPEEQRTTVERVDGIVPGWLVSPADAVLPTGTPGAPPVTCELEVAFDDGPSAEGAGEAASEDRASAAALAGACGSLGEVTCAPPAFLATIVARESSFQFTNGVSTSSFRVRLRLRRVRRSTASASSDISRAHACRDAYHHACEGTCPSATSRLVMLDGVALE